MAKNILVISDVFRNGGLETQICTLRDNLPEDKRFFYALGAYDRTIPLEEERVEDGFHFALAQTIGEIVEDTDRLVKIIREKNIDVIHCHPFYCLYAAVFASQITGKPLAYTYHGVGSFNFLKSVNESILFYHAFEERAVGTVFSVNERGVKTFEEIGYSNAVFLPNPIDLERFPIAERADNGRYAVFARLDADKVAEIESLLLQKEQYSIRAVDIYGSGYAEERLKQFICDNNLSDCVHLCGFSRDVYQSVNGKYSGIIGIGRVVLEALCMGLPAILIGYGRLTGFVNRKIYDQLKLANFSNMKIDDFNHTPASEREQKDICRDARKQFSARRLTQIYSEKLDCLKFVFAPQFFHLFESIRTLAADEQWAKVPFRHARAVFDFEQAYIGTRTLQRETQQLFAQANLSYELYDALRLETMRQNECDNASSTESL